MQASVVLDNILALIGGGQPWRTYTPDAFLEGAIKLTLGWTRNVVYAMDADGPDALVPAENIPLDLGVERVWKQFGAGRDFALLSTGQQVLE
jgi:apoptosis-inducing factor 2